MHAATLYHALQKEATANRVFFVCAYSYRPDNAAGIRSIAWMEKKTAAVQNYRTMPNRHRTRKLGLALGTICVILTRLFEQPEYTGGGYTTPPRRIERHILGQSMANREPDGAASGSGGEGAILVKIDTLYVCVY